MKYVYLIIIFTIVAAIGVQLFNLNSQRIEIEKKVESVSSKLGALKNENKELNKDFKYFSNFDNLAKEFKSLFNYKAPGEKLYIIVPEKQ